ncbi:MAG: glycosyltransferase [Planctomycetota bacterium]|nr:glycosyltransferase [Planctomycetota bacterium]
MKISFLLQGLGKSGGPFMLYRFMDKLSERGYEVYAITPTSKIKWAPSMSDKILSGGFYQTRLSYLKELAKKVLTITKTKEIVKKIFIKEKNITTLLWDEITPGLLNHWEESDITIATYWTTAYAVYMLMDKTIPLYYIQMYEELFSNKEINQKLARLTYFMPLVLMAGSYRLKDQIKDKIQKDAYILQPSIPAINCLDHGQKLDLKQKFLSAERIKILSFAKDNPSFGFPDMIETMRIVFSKLGKENIEWNIFGNNPNMKLPNDIPINYVKGRGKQLVPLFLESHIRIDANWYTGFAGGTLESMSAGTAIVTTSSNSKGVSINGQNCLVVPPRDITAFADAIMRLIQDRHLALKLAEGGLKTASDLTWDKATDNLEKIIKEVKQNYSFKGKFSDIPDLIRGDRMAINKTLDM